MSKKCEVCGKVFEPREPWYRFCSTTCRDKAESGGTKSHGSARPSSGRFPSYLDISTDFVFDSNYLEGGYYIQGEDGKPHLRAEDLDSWAREIAKLLAGERMKTHQVRRLFNHARGIEARLKKNMPFQDLQPDIIKFSPNSAYQFKRKVITEGFKQFIDCNIELAKQNEENFKGFIYHFESLVAYFVFYSRD